MSSDIESRGLGCFASFIAHALCFHRWHLPETVRFGTIWSNSRSNTMPKSVSVQIRRRQTTLAIEEWQKGKGNKTCQNEKVRYQAWQREHVAHISATWQFSAKHCAARLS